MLPVLPPLLPTTERSVCSYVRQGLKANVHVGNLPVLQNSSAMSHWLMVRRAGRVVHFIITVITGTNSKEAWLPTATHTLHSNEFPLNPVSQLTHTTICTTMVK